jgi:hypothetical protein
MNLMKLLNFYLILIDLMVVMWSGIIFFVELGYFIRLNLIFLGWNFNR